MKGIKGLCGDLTERLELPAEAVSGAVRLTAVGDRRLLLEHHRGLLEYGSERIRVSTGRGSVLICGSDLSMTAMNGEELLITGRLQSLEWA